MKSKSTRIPPGPVDKYDATQDLLVWMSEQFKRYGDIYKASAYGTSIYVISAPEYAEHVLLKNWQNYRKGQAIKRIALLLGNGIMVSEGDFWVRQRRMLQPAFHRKVVSELTGVIQTANTALLKKWGHAAQQRTSVNVTHDISLMVLEVVLISLFGSDYPQVAPHFNILSEEPARNVQFAQSFGLLGKLVIQVADQRRQENRIATDILGMLMQARDRNGEAMSDRQLAREMMTLVVAGHETTASVLNWIWYLLSQHPAVDDKLAAELSNLPEHGFPEIDELPKFIYTRQVIEEAMRLYPPGWLMTRKAVKDDQLGDYFVPAGTEIYIAPYLIQRHPALWEDPDRFDPERFGPDQSQGRHPLAMLPFSAGPRNCIGEFFARIEMQIHLMVIARRLRLRYTETTPPELDAGVNLRSRYDFMMTPELRTDRP
jgi:cytochrome P450